MPVWRLRDFADDDLDQAIQVWDQSRTPGAAEPVFPVAEVVAAARAGQPAVVAEVGDQIEGMAVARTEGERAWVLLVALASQWRQRGIGSALLAGFRPPLADPVTTMAWTMGLASIDRRSRGEYPPAP